MLLNRMGLLFLLLVALFISACSSSNPTDAELKKGENFDFFNEHGVITEKAIGYFESEMDRDDAHLKRIAARSEGEAYYSITIRRGTSSIMLRGVSRSMYERNAVGDELPLRIVITEKTLYEIEGTVMDMQADLDDEKWSVVVEDFGKHNVYPVIPEVYYNKELIFIGKRYPLPLPPELEQFELQ
ncbi:hypothetical protein ACFL08_03035 [Patescibacteria group bacterium]